MVCETEITHAIFKTKKQKTQKKPQKNDYFFGGSVGNKTKKNRKKNIDLTSCLICIWEKPRSDA